MTSLGEFQPETFDFLSIWGVHIFDFYGIMAREAPRPPGFFDERILGTINVDKPDANVPGATMSELWLIDLGVGSLMQDEKRIGEPLTSNPPLSCEALLPFWPGTRLVKGWVVVLSGRSA
jgi:hypothetical protein